VIQAAASGVPLWLQITTIALAPIIGFAGVAIGAHLKTRSDRAGYLRDERRKLYVAFIHAFGSFLSMSNTETVRALQTQDPKRLAELPSSARASMIELEKLRQEVMLIGSPPVVKASGDAMIYVPAVLSQTAVSMQGGFDRDTWSEMTRFGMQAQNAFIHAAQVDLGLPTDEFLSSSPVVDPALRRRFKDSATGIVAAALAEEHAQTAAPDGSSHGARDRCDLQSGE
jgi:hypothetical protein